MIIGVLTRIFLIPVRGRRRIFDISATVVGILGAAVVSRLQNDRIEEVHRQIELLQGPRTNPIAIVEETRARPYSVFLRMMHLVVKIAPVMTGMSPRQMLRYVVWGLMRNGYPHTVDNMPGYMTREQTRRIGVAPHPELSYQINSPRNIFNRESLERVDVNERRRFTDSADLITVHADSRVVIVLGTLVLYARVLLVFLLIREIYYICGEYLASKNIVVIDSAPKVKRRRATRSSALSKKE